MYPNKFFKVENICAVCHELGTVVLLSKLSNELFFCCLSCGVPWKIDQLAEKWKHYTLTTFAPKGIKLPSKEQCKDFSIIENLDVKEWIYYNEIAEAIIKGLESNNEDIPCYLKKIHARDKQENK